MEKLLPKDDKPTIVMIYRAHKAMNAMLMYTISESVLSLGIFVSCCTTLLEEGEMLYNSRRPKSL